MTWNAVDSANKYITLLTVNKLRGIGEHNISTKSILYHINISTSNQHYTNKTYTISIYSLYINIIHLTPIEYITISTLLIYQYIITPFHSWQSMN